MMKGHFPEEWILREGKNLVFMEGNLGSTKTSFLHVLGVNQILGGIYGTNVPVA
jgi:hypothetical protein